MFNGRRFVFGGVHAGSRRSGIAHCENLHTVPRRYRGGVDGGGVGGDGSGAVGGEVDGGGVEGDGDGAGAGGVEGA